MYTSMYLCMTHDDALALLACGKIIFLLPLLCQRFAVYDIFLLPETCTNRDHFDLLIMQSNCFKFTASIVFIHLKFVFLKFVLKLIS
jgi:hypothetical protein